MKEEYLKEKVILEKTDEDRKTELLKNIVRTREELKNTNTNFEYADPELIDYYVYKIKANQSKLDCLIKEAKEKGFVLDMINAINIRENFKKTEAG